MNSCEGGCVNRLLSLDGTNYTYWKARMRVFIKSLDQKAWIAVLKGWSPPVQRDRDGNVTIKDLLDWSPDEDRVAHENIIALNAIFLAVDDEQFKFICRCESVKEAWDILQNIHEGPLSMRRSRLQLLASQFDDLRMGDDESIVTFCKKLCHIANKADQLGEEYSETELVKKTLRSLPKRFDPKVVLIETVRDISTMKLEELMWSLQTYEMKYHKGIKRDDDFDVDEDIASLIKKIGQMLKKLKRKWQDCRSTGNNIS